MKAELILFLCYTVKHILHTQVQKSWIKNTEQYAVLLYYKKYKRAEVATMARIR